LLGVFTIFFMDRTWLEAAVGGLNLSNNISLAGEVFVNSTFGSAFTLGGTISGTGLLNVNGVTLSGANTYTGDIVLSQGDTLAVGNNAALGTSTLTMFNGATLQAAADGLNLSNNISLVAVTDTVDTNGFVLTLGGTISGNNTSMGGPALAKVGAGTLVLSAREAYGGGTSIAAGTLELGSGAGVGNVTFTGPSATLQLDTSVSQLRGSAIAGAAASDNIDLRFQAFTSGDKVVWHQNGATGTLMLETSAGSVLQSLTLEGQYTWANFSAKSDNNGGTLIEVVNAPPPNPPPPPSTTAVMIMSHGADGQYGIYDLGNNAILADYPLDQVGTDWQFAGLGDFNGADSSDMLMRNTNTGGFEVHNIANNNITNPGAFMGTVGLECQASGVGNFSSIPGASDMILRNTNTGGLEGYDISNNQIVGASFMGTVGLDWQVGGFGNFSSRGTSDMILRSNTTGGLQVYDIDHTQITGTAFMGRVGLEWQASGVGNFSSIPGESDMILRNTNTGGLELYNIANNQITGAAFIGAVGLDWQFAGIAPIHGPSTSDLVLRNVNTGDCEIYNISHNQITGAALMGNVGVDWQVGGFAADPPTTSMGSADASTSQLVQAMAGFGGGSGAAISNTVPLGADTSQQQQSLTMPQHA
jgi:autotransporter-associated beta strand protein